MFYDVTFRVDMSTYVFQHRVLNGSFNGWCGGCTEMTDNDGDMVYEVTVALAEGTFEYKFFGRMDCPVKSSTALRLASLHPTVTTTAHWMWLEKPCLTWFAGTAARLVFQSQKCSVAPTRSSWSTIRTRLPTTALAATCLCLVACTRTRPTTTRWPTTTTTLVSSKKVETTTALPTSTATVR